MDADPNGFSWPDIAARILVSLEAETGPSDPIPGYLEPLMSLQRMSHPDACTSAVKAIPQSRRNEAVLSNPPGETKHHSRGRPSQNKLTLIGVSRIQPN